MGRFQVNDTVLSQWCQRNSPNLSIAELAQQNSATVTQAFQVLTNTITQCEHKALLWASFSSNSLDTLKICQELRKPLVPSDKSTYHGLALNLWAYIWYLNVLIIDGAGANAIFDVGTFQQALDQPQNVCKYLTRGNI